MFENLLFQQHIVNSLTKEIKDNSLPQSILFYGDAFSGKLTAALELARVINCNLNGDWGCSCKSCNQNLSLQHPYLILTGNRYSMLEIKQSSEFLLTNRTKASQYIFIRNVRKLVKRFSEDLWEKEDTKYKKSISSLNKIEENLYLVEPSEELPSEKKLKSLLKTIIDECQKIANELPKGNIPISQIRNISNWVRRSSSGNKKVVILEKAELMQESSRNALLKVLEEPPSDTYFILLSEKRSTVLPTILSRVRSYAFKSRDKNEQVQILNKLFITEDKFDSIKDFFLSYSDFEEGALSLIAKQFLQFCFDKNSSFNDALEKKIDIEFFSEFLSFFTEELKLLYTQNSNNFLTLNNLECINGFIRDKVIKQSHFNQNPMLLLETLFYEIKSLFYA